MCFPWVFLSQQRTHRTAKNPGHHVSPLNSVREGRGKRWRSRRIGPNVPNLQNYTENEHWTYDIPTEPFVSLVQRAKTHIWLCVMAPGTDQFFFFFFFRPSVGASLHGRLVGLQVGHQVLTHPFNPRRCRIHLYCGFIYTVIWRS